MKRLMLFLALSGPLGFQQALLTLTGASCVEELSEDEMQRYQTLAAHPVDLNLAGRSRLLATGLLSPYQVASLLDYRSRTGEVLSWSELALVDGFGADFVEALREFAVLGEGGSLPGHREERRLTGSVTLRGGVRGVTEPAGEGSGGGGSGGGGGALFSEGSAAGGIKLEAAAGERAALFLSARNTLSDQRFSSPTFSVAYYGRRTLGQLILGHFNARFGQGLVQWSGFQLSGYNSVGAFRRNGTGLSPTGSFSPSLTGVAADWHFGSWRLSAAYSFGITWEDVGRFWSGGAGLPIVNLTWMGRTATFGLTATSRAAGFEARWSLPGGWSLFGEAASTWTGLSDSGTASDDISSDGAVSGRAAPSAFGNWLQTVSALGGAVFVPSYGHKLALLGRWYGPGAKQFSGLALGYSGPSLETTLDAGVRTSDGQQQVKSVTQWKPVFEWAEGTLHRVSGSSSSTTSASDPSPRTLVFRPQLRFVARWRPEDDSGSQAGSASLLSPSTDSASSSISGSPVPGLRLELRGALAAEYGPWTLGGRYDAVWFRDFAWNWYAEAGRKTERWAVWLRGGIFKVDDWDDRIYVYERDAPGSFTVPARYGRGWNASLYAAWHIRSRTLDRTSSPASGQRASSIVSRSSLWLRLETVQYPWNLIPKPGRLEARLQYRYKW